MGRSLWAMLGPNQFVRVAVVVIIAAAGVVIGLTVSHSGSSTAADKPTEPSAQPVATSSTSSAAPTPSASWTPPPYGAAKPAVDVYLQMQKLYAQIGRHPVTTSAELAKFNTYVIGQAQDLFDGWLSGTEYYALGTPDISRVEVTSANLKAATPHVALTDCALPSTSDPLRIYSAKTHRQVEMAKPKVPPPYLDTATVVKINGRWRVDSYRIDQTRTCSR